jgi:hypothetical protein
MSKGTDAQCLKQSAQPKGGGWIIASQQTPHRVGIPY